MSIVWTLSVRFSCFGSLFGAAVSHGLFFVWMGTNYAETHGSIREFSVKSRPKTVNISILKILKRGLRNRTYYLERTEYPVTGGREVFKREKDWSLFNNWNIGNGTIVFLGKRWTRVYTNLFRDIRHRN